MKVFLTSTEASQFSNPLFVDCRHLLTDPAYGERAYQEEHLPGAVFAHLDNTLSAEPSGKNGRHPLPDLHRFHDWLQTHGLHPERSIITYDNLHGGIAARLWWLLTQLGFHSVYIMTDGLEGWKAHGLKTETDMPQPHPVTFDLTIQSWDDGPYTIKYLTDISEQIPSSYLIDSRAPERYHGKEEPYDPLPGRIPGAINLFWQSNISDGTLKTERKGEINSFLDTGELGKYTVYCGSGVTATFNLAVFAELNLPRPSYYAGSYSEWVQNHPDTIETDE